MERPASPTPFCASIVRPASHSSWRRRPRGWPSCAELLCAPECGGWLDPRAGLGVALPARPDWWNTGTLEAVDPRIARGSAGGGEAFTRSWCRGSTGIVLGKLAEPADFDLRRRWRAEMPDGLENKVRNTGEHEIFVKEEADEPCCSHMGHVEALLFANSRLGEERYLGAALAGDRGGVAAAQHGAATTLDHMLSWKHRHRLHLLA